jgi:hypothetical protein
MPQIPLLAPAKNIIIYKHNRISESFKDNKNLSQQVEPEGGLIQHIKSKSKAFHR